MQNRELIIFTSTANKFDNLLSINNYHIYYDIFHFFNYTEGLNILNQSVKNYFNLLIEIIESLDNEAKYSDVYIKNLQEQIIIHMKDTSKNDIYFKKKQIQFQLRIMNILNKFQKDNKDDLFAIYKTARQFNYLDIFYVMIEKLLFFSCKLKNETDTKKLKYNVKYSISFFNDTLIKISFDIMDVLYSLQDCFNDIEEIKIMNEFVRKNNLPNILYNLHSSNYKSISKKSADVYNIINHQINFNNELHNKEQTIERMRNFTNGLFDNLNNWENIAICGGSVFNCCRKNITEHPPNSDIDIFLYGPDMKNTLKRLLEYLDNEIRNKFGKAVNIYYGRDRSLFHILIENIKPSIQIVCNNSSNTISDVLTKFDLSHIKLAFSNNEIYATGDAVISLY